MNEAVPNQEYVQKLINEQEEYVMGKVIEMFNEIPAAVDAALVDEEEVDWGYVNLIALAYQLREAWLRSVDLTDEYVADAVTIPIQDQWVAVAAKAIEVIGHDA